MSDEDEDEISNVEIQDTIGSSTELTLSEEWVTWLASADVPECVTGVDSNHDDLGSAESYA